eukprot:10474346-Karenia_brevis.AAC.1
MVVIRYQPKRPDVAPESPGYQRKMTEYAVEEKLIEASNELKAPTSCTVTECEQQKFMGNRSVMKAALSW